MRAKGLTEDGKPRIPEKLFQEQVRKAAILTGWRYFHAWNSMRSPEGFPDCVLVHAAKKRLIFAELKSDNGKATQAQLDWLADCRAIPGVEAYLLRPADFDWFWEKLKEGSNGA